MLQIGIRQPLVIVSFTRFGAYLAEPGREQERVLLPKKQVPPEASEGDQIEVFLYRDSQDRIIATTNTPAITLGGIGMLTVKQVTRIGAFLDWGLEKDLLLPFAQQTYPVREGEQCLAALYVDKSGRLCATMKVYPYLQADAPYDKDSRIEGIIYDSSPQFGLFVAVDGKYSGLIPRKEVHGALAPGQRITGRVTKRLPDGRLNISVREKAYVQMDADGALILKVLDEYDGVLPFGEKVSPEVIDRTFGISKAAFKRAAGRLLKQGRISISDDCIRREEPTPSKKKKS